MLLQDLLIVTPGQAVRPASIEIAPDGTIAALHDTPASWPHDLDIVFDGKAKLYAFPGFIDIHSHGANGADVSDAKPDAIHTFAQAKLKEGVTTLLPTTWTASPEHLVEMAQAVAAYREAGEPFARTPCLHVEGPFLNPRQAGAQDPQHMRAPDVEEIRRLNQVCPVGLVSLAPELPEAGDFIRAMGDLHIMCSAAHSAATYQQFLDARQAGLAHLTHFCNQMSPLHHREIGLVGAGLLDDSVMIELIPDLLHLNADMLRLLFKHIPCDRIMLITDSMAASHLGDGEYPIGDTIITVKDGAARIPAGNLAGSVLQYNESVRHIREITGLPLPIIAKTTGANQAHSLKLHDRGHLRPGQLADIVLLDNNFEVQAVFVGGHQRV